MENKLILESARVIELIEGGSDDEYEFIDSEFAGECRWGLAYEIVIREKSSGKLWGSTYQVQVGDNYHNSLEDSSNTHLYAVEAFEKTVTEYRRIKNV